MRARALIVFLVLLAAVQAFAQAPAPTPRFGDQIEAYLKADLTNPPPKGAVLFIGSSIFRLWKNLDSQLAPLPVFNRAFGGSRTGEVLAQTDRLVLPYEPRIIVYYCGSNDINGGETPESIFGRYREFSEKVAARLPETKIYFVSIIRAPQKENRWPAVDTANRLVREYSSKTKKREFIDVNPALFGPDGKARRELYVSDGLHLTDQGYVEMTKVIKPVLEKAWSKERKNFCRLNPARCADRAKANPRGK